MEKIQIVAQLGADGSASLSFAGSDELFFDDICRAAGVPENEKLRDVFKNSVIENTTLCDGKESKGGDGKYLPVSLVRYGTLSRWSDSRFSTNSAAELQSHARKVRRALRNVISDVREAWEKDSDKITPEFIEDVFPIEI